MDLLKVAVVILFIILTVFTIKIHPEMHQPMIIEDADFKLTRISDTLENIPTTPVTNPSQEKNVQVVELPPQQNQQQQFEQQPQRQTKIVETNTPKSQQKQVNVKPETSQLELLERIIKNADQSVETPQQPKTVQKPVSQPVTKPAETVKPQQPKQVQQSNKNPYMTEQEEIIAWNKWRSNIQNRIMKDSQIDYAPLGTAFMFTFIVDKFGNVSNIKVECSNPNFAAVARNNVKPAISALQRKPILNFPRGTQRTSTVVTGIFLIGTQERYSTPDDFSDFERITF